jgi:predicted nuclease of restriction endonuclease-like (RecB) superfamily
MNLVRTSAIAIAFLLAVAASSSAQEQDQQALQNKLDAKLKEPFVSKVPWVLDFAEAMKKAKAENKLIFVYFTRSYAP